MRLGSISARMAVTLALLGASGYSLAGHYTQVHGDPTSISPTLRSLSLEWRLGGDTNRNSRVQVAYRLHGCTTCSWRDAMDLIRVDSQVSDNHHSGSILDLEIGRAYDVRLRLTDLDNGSTWGETRTLFGVSTRAQPADPPNPRIRDVTPSNLSGTLSSSAPGDILVLGAGTYAGFTVPNNGTADRPIVIRAANRDNTVVSGNVILNDRAHVHLENLRINGTVRCNNSRRLAIRRNVITIGSASADGIACRTRSEASHIADNVVTGPAPWDVSAFGERSTYTGKGIVVTGPGHSIEYNRVKGFRDAISLMEGSYAVDQYSIDINNNEIDIAVSDAIQVDSCIHNCRALRNSIRNAFMGISFQPTLQGPTYSIRNVMYSLVMEVFKLHNGSTGNVMYHNTAVKNGDALSVYSTNAFRNTLMRNNIFIGGPGGNYNGYYNNHNRVIHIESVDLPSFNFNYDAFGFEDGSFNWRLNDLRYSSLTELRNRTTARNAIRVWRDIFNVLPQYPSPLSYYSALPDLRLKPGSAPWDYATPIHNVNIGPGADLGAYEGSERPHYGPRLSTTTSSTEDEASPRPRGPRPRS